MPTESIRYPEERRLATILFADVHSFTPLAEQLDAETVSELINSIWDSLDDVIEKHGGYIDKHLGDGVMAIWGAPVAGERDAENAVAAGLELTQAIKKLSQKVQIKGAENLQLRVGINTGQVFAGHFGKRREYTVIGDAVNVAARLEQIAEPDRVVIGENTLRMVRGNFRVKRLEPTHVKGKTELVQPYEVEGRLTSPGRINYQSGDSLITVMVGREIELEKLKFYYYRAFEMYKPILALVKGEIGIGKSRLLMEFANTLDQMGDPVHILATRGLAQTSKIPFYLWRVLLRNRFGLRDDESVQASTDKWVEQMHLIWEADKEETRLEATQVLGEMIGLATKNLAPDEKKLERIFYLTRELLRRLSHKKRLVLFFDDLQWGDRESLLLLSHVLSTEEPPFQMLVVASARPEFLSNNPQWHNLGRILTLESLSLTPRMVAKAYPDIQDLPEQMLEEIIQHADGNPYFLEEIIKNLIQGGLLEHKGDFASRQAHLLETIPESLRGTLQARLENLSREARTVALLASVVGRVFWVGSLMAEARSRPMPGTTPMINIPEPVIERFIQDGLRQLVRAELAFPRSGSKFSEEQEYIFKNSYLRDVAYSLIPHRNRAQYHKAVADWLKQKTDPAYQTMANEHEKNAVTAAKISTGSLPPIFSEP